MTSAELRYKNETIPTILLDFRSQQILSFLASVAGKELGDNDIIISCSQLFTRYILLTIRTNPTGPSYFLSQGIASSTALELLSLRGNNGPCLVLKMQYRFANMLPLIFLISVTFPAGPTGNLPAVEASFLNSAKYLRELLLTPEVTECLKSVPEEDVDEYFELLSAAQFRCDRRNVAFEACLELLRRSQHMSPKMRNVDRTINVPCPKID
ncbi:uncharacterized protein LOC111247350 [Varroa destructor]|uniref:Uncharacterized protein n=1 Tax=Varroa destructor TaxID=109461 RepID=A0A7M7JX01_VARDE|nr:uncharacterized protein LOC111247350 [Varroa destructor]